MANEGTGVDVDGGHRLGLIDDQVTAGLELHLALQRLADLVLHAIEIEDGSLAGIVFDAAGQLRDELVGELAYLFIGGARIDAHLFDDGTGQIAHGAHHQRQILVNEAAGRLGATALADVVPQLLQEAHIVDQRFLVHPFGHGTQDVATGIELGGMVGDDALETGTFGLVLDLLGHADVIGARHVHQITGGNGNLGGQARALGAHGILDHLHQHFLPFAEQLHDGGRVLAIGLALGGTLHDVVGVQEGGTFQADLEKGRLHAWQHPL